ncbi:MAG TPA: YtxH domain-containing protein [Puia sp.]
MNKTLITLLIGIGIGILLAPDKGSETWKKLKDGLNDFKDKLADEADELGEQAENIVREER